MRPSRNSLQVQNVQAFLKKVDLKQDDSDEDDDTLTAAVVVKAKKTDIETYAFLYKPSFVNDFPCTSSFFHVLRHC